MRQVRTFCVSSQTLFHLVHVGHQQVPLCQPQQALRGAANSNSSGNNSGPHSPGGNNGNGSHNNGNGSHNKFSSSNHRSTSSQNSNTQYSKAAFTPTRPVGAEAKAPARAGTATTPPSPSSSPSSSYQGNANKGTRSGPNHQSGHSHHASGGNGATSGRNSNHNNARFDRKAFVPATMRPLQRIVHAARAATTPAGALEAIIRDFEAHLVPALSTSAAADSSHGSAAPSSSSSSDTTPQPSLPLVVAGDFLRTFCRQSSDVVPYVSYTMRALASAHRLDDVRLLFAVAIRENMLRDTLPEEFFRVFLTSASHGGSFTRDEIANVLLLADRRGVALSLLSKVCLVEMMLKLGVDVDEGLRGAVTRCTPDEMRAHGDDAQTLVAKLADLLRVLVAGHYSARWALQLLELCTILRAPVSPALLAVLLRKAAGDHTVPPAALVHVLEAALKAPEAPAPTAEADGSTDDGESNTSGNGTVSSNNASSSSSTKASPVTTRDLLHVIQRCRQHDDHDAGLAALDALAPLLAPGSSLFHTRPDQSMSASSAAVLSTAISAARMHHLGALRRFEEAMALLQHSTPLHPATGASSSGRSMHGQPSAISADLCRWSDHALLLDGVAVTDRHPPNGLAAHLAAAGPAAIDDVYYMLERRAGPATPPQTPPRSEEEGGASPSSGGGDTIPPTTAEAATGGDDKVVAAASAVVATGPDAWAPTAVMLDVIMHACALLHDDVRAQQTLDSYALLRLPLTTAALEALLTAPPSPAAAIALHPPVLIHCAAGTVSLTTDLLRILLSQATAAGDAGAARRALRAAIHFRVRLCRASTARVVGHAVATADATTLRLVLDAAAATGSSLEPVLLAAVQSVMPDPPQPAAAQASG